MTSNHPEKLDKALVFLLVHNGCADRAGHAHEFFISLPAQQGRGQSWRRSAVEAGMARGVCAVFGCTGQLTMLWEVDGPPAASPLLAFRVCDARPA